LLLPDAVSINLCQNHPMLSTMVRTSLLPVVAMGALLAALSGCGGSEPEATASAPTDSLTQVTTITVTHPAVPAPTLIRQVEGASSVGDVRLWNFDGTTEDAETVTMDWIMTTTSVNVPEEGLETRFATGVFTFASTDNANVDQIILEGVAYYPTAGSVLESASSTVRAVVGGTGRFDGARGSVESIHLADDTWRHVFTLR
jgi:hypothetical protein